MQFRFPSLGFQLSKYATSTSAHTNAHLPASTVITEASL
jgi:hypothetical protein